MGTASVIQNYNDIAEIDRAYSKYFKNDPAFGDRYNDPHNPNTEFIFHDLLEHLVLISYFLYGKSKALPVHDNGVAGTFAYFLKTHILNMPDANPKSNFPHDRQCLKILNYAEEQNRALLVSVFHELAHRTSRSLPGATKDLAFSYREFCLMLKVNPISYFRITISLKNTVDYL